MIVKHTTFNLTIQNSNLSILCNPSHLYIYRNWNQEFMHYFGNFTDSVVVHSHRFVYIRMLLRFIIDIWWSNESADNKGAMASRPA